MVGYIYERDDGVVRSWLDHILCSQHNSTLVTDVYAVHTCSNLSDHDPLFFKSIFNLFPCLLLSQVHTGTLVSIGLRLPLLISKLL